MATIPLKKHVTQTVGKTKHSPQPSLYNLLSGNVHPVENIPEDDPHNLVVPEVEDDPFPVVFALCCPWRCSLCRRDLNVMYSIGWSVKPKLGERMGGGGGGSQSKPLTTVKKEEKNNQKPFCEKRPREKSRKKP
jgi:hypothetical protein